MNIYIPYTARLPSAYQEVEYIETTGTQYITTSITPNTNTQVEVKIEVTTTAMDKTIFGTNRGSTYYHLTPYSYAWYYGLNGVESHAGTYSNVVGTQYEVVYNNSNSQLSINGTEVGSTSGTTSTNPLEIAKRASDNTKGVFKYFYFNVYNKSTSEYLLKLVPCYRKSDNVIGMYDLVNNQFYTNSGTGTFSKGNDVNMSVLKNIYIGEYKSRLPSAYQQVEYIQSSGSQYIDTGIANVSINTRLEYSYTPMANNNGLVFMDNGWESNGIGNGWNYYYYGSGSSSWSRYFTQNVVGVKVDMVISNTECSKNGGDTAVPGISSLAPIGTVLLFKNRRNGTIEGGASSKCHYYRRYDNGTLVQELVPCYRKSDGVIGMYDIVNGVFYTNQGTGTFTKGPDVN